MFLAVGVSVRALVESIAASGYEVKGVDFFGDIDANWQGRTIGVAGDCGLKPSIRNVFTTAGGISCDGLVYASGVENSPQELQSWEAKGLLYGNGPSVLREVREIGKLQASLEQIQMKMPESHPLAQWQQLDHQKRWLLKPVNRGGGHGITEIPAGEAEAENLLRTIHRDGSYIIQEYWDGIPASATFIADGREAVLLGTSRQLVGSQKAGSPFSYEGNIVPLALPSFKKQASLEEELRIMSGHLTREFGLKGLNTIDFMLNAKGIRILELNPRWSASVELIERHLGYRLFTSHLAACRGKLELPAARRLSPCSGYWGKKIIYAKAAFTTRAEDEQAYRALYNLGVRDIPRPGTLIAKGQPLCTVLAEGSSSSNCYKNLHQQEEKIRQYYLTELSQ